jgi:hypothetical protein
MMKSTNISIIIYPDYLNKLKQITRRRKISKYVRDAANWKFVNVEEPPHSPEDKINYSIRISSEEAEALRSTADYYNVTISKLVRCKILVDYQDLINSL